MDEWMRSLKDASEAVRPTGGAAEQVVERVGRRRRRTAFTTLGAAAAVAAIIGTGISLLPQDGRKEAVPIQSPGAETPEVSDAAGFSCATESKVFTENPPLPDLEEQKRIVGAINLPLWKGFGVRHAAPSPLGVVALVTGELEAARRALPKQGVALVYPWLENDPDIRGARNQIDQVVHWQLDPVVEELGPRLGKRAGFGGMALWRSAGAILVQWQPPVPADVRRVEDHVYESGVRVVVEEVRYSRAETQRAQERVADAIRAGKAEVPWTSAYACHDGAGIVVGVDEDKLGDRRAELQELLSPLAGMPVMVVPEGPIEPMTGDAVSPPGS